MVSALYSGLTDFSLGPAGVNVFALRSQCLSSPRPKERFPVECRQKVLALHLLRYAFA